MRIKEFKIENYRNIKLAECINLPDFVVICGGNGCGKTSILQALMTIKENLGRYGYFPITPKAVSADSDKAIISINLELNDQEIKYLREVDPNNNVSNNFSATLQILKNGTTSFIDRTPGNLNPLFGRFSQNSSFFDYFSANRVSRKNQLTNWDVSFLNEDNIKRLLSEGENKYQFIKQFLASLKMKDLQNIQKMIKDDKEPQEIDSLEPIRSFFNKFFSPMEFDDVYINTSPFEFLIETPRGKIDIDELSSGEKEILNTFIYFYQLQPKNSIILFDEPDVHLHPELQRKYLRVLRELSEGNQFIITTHSPEMMIEAGYSSLFTVLKYQNKSINENQFVRVSENQQLHNILSEIMGSKGFVSLNRKIVFIEGEESSADIQFYEKFFPQEEYNITFVPAGNSSTIISTSEKINYLLSQGSTFHEYYCIIDGDIDREEFEGHANLLKLPVYHVENYLLDEELILQASQMMLKTKCQYANRNEVADELKNIVLEDSHLLPFTKALLDSRIYKLSKKATDLIYQKKFEDLKEIKGIEFNEIKNEAVSILRNAIINNQWKKICKGRDILKGYCQKNGMNYEQFRNVLITIMPKVPEELNELLKRIIT